MSRRARRVDMVIVFLNFTLNLLLLERERTSFIDESFAILAHGETDTSSVLSNKLELRQHLRGK